MKKAHTAMKLRSTVSCLGVGSTLGLLWAACSTTANLTPSYVIDSSYVQAATHYKPVVQRQSPRVAFGHYALVSLAKEKSPFRKVSGNIVEEVLFPSDEKIKERQFQSLFTTATDSLTASFILRIREIWEIQRFKLFRKNPDDDKLEWQANYLEGTIMEKNNEEWLFTVGPFHVLAYNPTMQEDIAGQIIHRDDTLFICPLHQFGNSAGSTTGLTVVQKGKTVAMALIDNNPQIWLSEEPGVPVDVIGYVIAMILAARE